MNPDFGRNSYESIPIPEKLNEIVAQTIASRNKEEIHMSYENTNSTYKTKNMQPCKAELHVLKFWITPEP